MFFVNVRCASASIMEVTAMYGGDVLFRKTLTRDNVVVLRDALTKGLAGCDDVERHGIPRDVIHYNDANATGRAGADDKYGNTVFGSHN